MRLRRRLLGAGTTLAVVAGLLSAGASSPATADVSGMAQGSSLSAVAHADVGSLSITPKVTLLGIGLSGLLGSVTSNLTPLLQALPGALTTALNTALTGTGTSVTNPAQSQPRPASGYPTCGQAGWDSSDCYGPLLPTVSAPSLVTVSTGAAQGYATGDQQGYIAAAQVADPNVSLLGVSLGDLGVSSSTASCDTTPTCTASHTLSGGSLFNGGLTYSIASGNLLAKVGNITVPTTPIAVGNTGITASLGGNLLTLTIPLPLTQLLGALGTTLTALGPLLGGGTTDANSSLSLVVTIGPGQVTTGTANQSSAWGVDIGVGLTGSIGLNVGGLANVSIALTTGTANQPDLTDLKLAYSQAVGGSLLPDFVPPGLI
ncbi:hypothetical protein [Jatrophihabitans endophyticus]|uniref:hypothetical protein n=1 Tax=Jatrophihabitans endophyticus TaxID=1206085 RepID=UPI0019F037C1|nr:hypothetical protein [Jatrophihabitans endophyticus]MBE7189290.1 hypothetical protein [Jatrophihabitans endophyticus]